MTEVFTATATIERPVEHVWKELTDWPRAGRWMAGVTKVEANSDTRPGTVLTFHTRGKARTSTIAAADPERTLTLTSQQGGVRADYTYTLQPAGAQTRIRLTADCTTRGLWSLAAPALRRFIRRADSSQLDALKHHIEQDQP